MPTELVTLGDGDNTAHSRITCSIRALGSSLLMVFLALQGSVIANPGFAMGVASAKTSLTFVQAFTRGIMCNWLVCMAGVCFLVPC